MLAKAKAISTSAANAGAEVLECAPFAKRLRERAQETAHEIKLGIFCEADPIAARVAKALARLELAQLG